MYWKISIALLSALSMMFVSCNKEKEAVPVVQKQVVKEVKKVEKKKNPKELLSTMKIDRSKTPFAGIWEPSSKSYGFLLMYPDGKFEVYSKYDQNCKRKPKKSGEYKVTGNRTIVFILNGKELTRKLKVLSGFVEIEDFGVYLMPIGLELKEENKVFTDPKELLSFCRNLNPSNVSKIYPYLTKQSKFKLMQVGITDQTTLAGHDKLTLDIKAFLRTYKKVESIKSLSRKGSTEVFQVILSGVDKNTYKEEIAVESVDGELKCGLFDKMTLKASGQKISNVNYWAKDILDNKAEQVFKSKNGKATLKLLFTDKKVTLTHTSQEKSLEVTGKYKLLVNVPTVVAIKVQYQVKTEEGKLKSSEENLVFKKASSGVEVIFKDQTYVKGK